MGRLKPMGTVEEGGKYPRETSVSVFDEVGLS